MTTRSSVRRPWVGLLALLTVIFLVYALPPYLGLDPGLARLPVPAQYPWYYPALVTHIFFGSVALLTACLQVWPWLRRHHPRLHRISGRVYLFAGVFPAGVAVLAVAPFSPTSGPTGRVGNLMLAVLWLATAVAGYRAARGRRFAEHREWMVRSVALSFSIVANRAWVVICLLVFAPEVFAGDATLAVIERAVAPAVWLSWVVNLLVAEWWLQRTRHRRRRAARPADRVLTPAGT